MKKTTILLVLLLVLLMHSCLPYIEQVDSITQHDVIPHTPITTGVTVTEPTTTQSLTYHPSEIVLEPNLSIQSELPFEVTMRRVFYTVSGFVLDLFPEDLVSELFFYEGRDFSIEPHEMMVVTLLRHYCISKEVFIAAVEEETAFRITWGFELLQEAHELPCPDIIFTFDNELIRAFYRRENPVAPDWWPLGYADEVRTFSSYTAFRAANPR